VTAETFVSTVERVRARVMEEFHVTQIR
jgi:hypothetical protein